MFLFSDVLSYVFEVPDVETCVVVSVVIVGWLLLKPCCVEICGILFVMYGNSVFSRVFSITERNEIYLYDICSCLCFVLEFVCCLLVSLCEG